MTALLPAIVNARTAHAAIYRARLGMLGGAVLIYGLCVALFMTVCGSFIIHVLYGSAFIDSVAILQIYVWAIPGLVMSLFVSNFLIAENFRRIQIVSAVVPMLLNVILNIFLIPQHGALGAAWATVVSYSLSPCICLCYTDVRRILFPRGILKHITS